MRQKGFGRVGVLSGGISSEREISLRSGKSVYDALVREGIDAVLLDVKRGIKNAIRDSRIDMAFIALHGKFGEDGTVQKMLEEAGIPYTGSGVEASRLAIDKIASKETFVRNGIPVCRHAVMVKGSTPLDILGDIGLPMVIKPQSEGSSIGLSIVREGEGIERAVKEAFKYGDKIMAEEYIEGRELTVGILADKALPVVEIVAANRVYDFAAKYNDSSTRYLVPAPVSKEVYERASSAGESAHKALGCRSFSRVDMIADNSGRVYVLEVNTIPGMTERSLLPKAAEAAGLRFGRLCVTILENALLQAGENHGQTKKS